MKDQVLSSKDAFPIFSEELEEPWFLYFTIKSKLILELRPLHREVAESEYFSYKYFIFHNRMTHSD
jgi:hypothetical protein